MGRRKNIDSETELESLFLRYVKETKGKPITVKDWVGKDAEEIHREKEKPLTIDGFECWLFENKIIADLGDYLRNKDNRYIEFATICSYIKQKIRQDQIEGGMAGIYNPSITQRLNGLVEKTQNDNIVQVKKFEVEIIDNNPDAES